MTGAAFPIDWPAVPGLYGRLVLAAADYRRSRLPWLRARQLGLGASDTATVLGLSEFPNATPLKVWLSKTQPITEDNWPNEAAEWGSTLEASVARKVATRHPKIGKLAPTPGILAHPEHPWMLATLDRLIVPRGRRGGEPTTCLEIKTAGDMVYRQRWIDGVPPDYIQVQCQQQLAVTGFDHLWLAVLVGGQRMPEPIRIERSEPVIERLIEYGGLWWRDHIIRGERPAPTMADRLIGIWPGDAALPSVTATDDLVDKLARHEDARRREDAAKAEKEHLAFQIQTVMQDRQIILHDGDVVATWKAGTERRLDTKKLAADHPELAAEYSPARPTRRFLNKIGDTQ